MALQGEQMFWNPTDRKWRTRSEVLEKKFFEKTIIEKTNHIESTTKFEDEGVVGMKLR